MTALPECSLRCSGFPLDTALQLELLERIAPGSESGDGDGVSLLHQLAASMEGIGLAAPARLLREARDEFSRLIDIQFRNRGGLEDWAGAWLNLVVLGSVNDPRSTLDRIRALTGWSMHELLLQTDLVCRPIAHGSATHVTATLRLHSPVRVTPDQHARFRDELEPAGVVGIYDRSAAEIRIERPSQLHVPGCPVDAAVLEEGLAPRLRLLIDLGLVERVDIGFPTPWRPRTAVERQLLRLVVPRAAVRRDGAMGLEHLARLLDMPRERLRCHVQQVAHSQEWAQLLFEYLTTLVEAYRGLRSAARWSPEQHAAVLARHVSLDPRLVLDRARLDGPGAPSEDTIAAFFRTESEQLRPHAALEVDAGTSQRLLARIASAETVSSIVSAAGDRLLGLAESIERVQPASAKPSPPEPWSSGSLPPLPQRQSVNSLPAMLGFVRRHEADADWKRAQDAYAEFLSEAERRSRRIAFLEARNDESRQATLAWATAGAVSHAGVAVRCVGVALRSSSQFGRRISSLHAFRDALLLGSSEPSAASQGLPGQLVDGLLRQAVVGESPAGRAHALAAVLYYLLRFDECPDHVAGVSPTDDLPYSMADDLEVLLGAAEERSVGDAAVRARMRSMLDSGFAQQSSDSEARAEARRRVERLACWLLGVAPEARRT